MSTLGTILKDNWEWRTKIAHLAVFDLKKQSRGAVLGWAWFLIRPTIYIACFWFALGVGLRAGQASSGEIPYIVWLTAGLVPWFFMQKMISGGCDAFRSYRYLVNKIKFPLSGICTIFTESHMIMLFLHMILLVIVYFVFGMPIDIYLIQIPILIILMFVFWDMFSIMMSPLSALSKDVANAMKAIGTPMFWLSGVIFNLKGVDIPAFQAVMQFNPVTFFVDAWRCAVCEKTWFWDDPGRMIGFGVVFVLTLIVMVLVYRKLHEEVADVI